MTNLKEGHNDTTVLDLDRINVHTGNLLSLSIDPNGWWHWGRVFRLCNCLIKKVYRCAHM